VKQVRMKFAQAEKRVTSLEVLRQRWKQRLVSWGRSRPQDAMCYCGNADRYLMT